MSRTNRPPIAISRLVSPLFLTLFTNYECHRLHCLVCLVCTQLSDGKLMQLWSPLSDGPLFAVHTCLFCVDCPTH